MIVAVVAVPMVQAAVDQVIEMIAVRHLFVPATLVLALARRRGAMIGVGRVHRQNMFVVMTLMRRVQTAIVQIIDVAIVADARVSALFAVDVLVFVVDFVAHETILLGDRVAECIGFLCVQTRGQIEQTRQSRLSHRSIEGDFQSPEAAVIEDHPR